MKPKIFISWSGDLSRNLASELQNFLKAAIPIKYAEVFFSPMDMELGAPWQTSLRKVLSESTLVIAMLTREAARSAWVLFEWGAVAKELHSRLYPVLISSVQSKELPDPIRQFQSVTTTRDGLWGLVVSVAKHIRTKTTWQPDLKSLKAVYNTWYDTFEHRLQNELQGTLHAKGDWALVGSGAVANQIAASPFEAKHLFTIAKHQIDLVAQNHYFVTVDKEAEHFAVIREFLRNDSRRTVNFLLMDPNKRDSVRAWADLMSLHFPEDLQKACGSLRNWLKIAKKEKWKGRLEVKLTGIVPTSQSFVDATYPTGVLVMIPMINKPSNLDRPAIYITKQTNTVAFNAYWSSHFERFRRAVVLT